MFKIKENAEIENYEMEYPYHLIKDGTVIENVGAREIEVWNEKIEGMEKSFEIEAFDDKSRFLGEHKLKEFLDSSKVCLYGWRYFEDFQLNTIIYLNHGFLASFIDFQIIPNFSFWKRHYSFAEYQEVFHNILFEKFSDWEFYSSNNKYKGLTEIELTITHKFGENKINLELFVYESILEKIHIETIEILDENFLKNSLTAYFSFPEALQNPCKQYLIYFAAFLKDLGINSTSNLKEESGKILFSVMPTDDVEALNKIREALVVYLNLPVSPIIYDESFAAMRLQQQVENLQHSQRMAVRELQFNEKLLAAQSDQLREKNVTISQLQTSNEQLIKIVEKISSKSVMMDSLENKAEFEKVFDGLEFGESKELKEKLGIKFNPVTSLKSLGKKLGSLGDKITSLNLNDEAGKND